MPQLAALLLLVLWPFGATAAELFAQPGQEIIITTSDNELKLGEDAPAGTRVVAEFDADNKPTHWAILYKAPATSLTQPVTITYAEGTSLRSDSVVVTQFPGADNPHLVGQAGIILFSMLVLAVILESAFAVLFNWRVFLEFFDGRGVRTLVMFVSGLLIVNILKVDYVGALIGLYTGSPDVSGLAWLSTMLTALVLAGGSASVNKLMVALNLRHNLTVENVTPKAEPTKAWAAFDVHPPAGIDEVDLLRIAHTLPGAEASRLVGRVEIGNVTPRILKYFVRSTRRLPRGGGYALDPGTTYAFVLRAQDSQGLRYWDATGRSLRAIDEDAGSYDPAPESYLFAVGAVVDFTVDLDPQRPMATSTTTATTVPPETTRASTTTKAPDKTKVLTTTAAGEAPGSPSSSKVAAGTTKAAETS